MSSPAVIVRVQHHPSRVGLLPRLLPKLVGVEVEVVEDEPSTIRSPWRNYLECLRRPTNATHIVVVQDDAIPCDDFAVGCRAAIAARPDRLISFFLGGYPPNTAKAAREAEAAGETFAEVRPNDCVPTVALAWPVEAATHLLRWATPKAVSVRQTGDDAPVGKFARLTGRGALVTVPSLVEHPDDVPSTIGRRHQNGRNRKRVAAIWIGDRPVASIDWR